MVYKHNEYYVILYIEKFHDLPSTRWRPRKDGGVVPVEIHRTENMGANVVSHSLSLNVQELGVLMSKGRKRWMFQLKQRVNWHFFHLFVLFGPLKDCMMPSHISEGELLFFFFLRLIFTSVYQFTLISSRNTLTDTFRNNVLPTIWASLAQLSWHIQLAITNSRR